MSEIGQTERHWARTREPDAGVHWSRFRALRQRRDLAVIDLDLHELSVVGEITARRYLRRFGKPGRLGKGEAAVIALAENRGWTPIMDDRPGRQILSARVPGSSCFTTDDILRRAALRGLISSREAESAYQEMRRLGYRGPQRLWQPDG
ncbi:MAG TPA: hypothetical protein VGR71_06005 [Nitrospira sp.]|nr:hypothetical protein [Nitrospira sp.]